MNDLSLVKYMHHRQDNTKLKETVLVHTHVVDVFKVKYNDRIIIVCQERKTKQKLVPRYH